MDEARRRKLLRLVGLGVRGRLAVVGVQLVREAALRDKVLLAVVAPDASANSLNKIVPLLTARGVRVVDAPGAAELGAAVGRESTAVVGITDGQLAKGIQELVEAGSEGA